jgi:hypothetical protein
MNSYDRIYTLLTEGKTTGGDFEATFERLGKRKGHEDKNPNAKPGEPGYLRKMYPKNVNPDFPAEKEAQLKRKKRLQKKILTRAFKKETAKNKERKANRPSPTMGHATSFEGAVRQEREKQDFRLGMGDTSDLTPKGLKKNLKMRAKSAVKRGRDSV